MASPETKIKVAVLLGGDSSEREISFKTGRAMAAALSPARFDVTLFDVASPSTQEKEALFGTGQNAAATPLTWDQVPNTLRTGQFDVALPALHSGWGEDGTLQAALELAGIPYAGSPPRASMIAIDKQICKAVMHDVGIPVPRGGTINHPGDQAPWDGPCVIKPNAGGSSVGVTILRNPRDAAGWQRGVCAALSDGSSALVEEMIEGVEVTAGVLGQGPTARVLPLIEIVPQSAGGFYDYEAKYALGGSQHLIPPRLPQEVLARLSDYALRAHRVLGCRGVSRSDFIVNTDGTPYFLEINTLPGMTETSLVPDAARAAGISFDSLVETLVREALQVGAK
ncbi:MAG: D-alanine--D-alanine ligase [Abitibacteriaceae bacterium]|nr:D-alanine--D-alanine ligase [Abditibacteriaceae bacterium]MBV9867638.1 D-alanine--D-alanine ligase [Abditibacteriaceae bacterium]